MTDAPEFTSVHGMSQNQNTVHMEKTLRVVDVAWLCICLVRAFSQPLLRQCELMGWDIRDLRKIVSNAYHRMGVPC